MSEFKEAQNKADKNRINKCIAELEINYCGSLITNMIKFIKLTECKGNTIILNTSRIEHITLGAKGTDTYIKMLSNLQGKPNEPLNKENYFFVKESMNIVWEMLQDGRGLMTIGLSK